MLRVLNALALQMVTEAETDCGIEFHPLSLSFPLLEGDEFEQYVDDVRRKGPTDKIYLFEEKILDGRNLCRAMAHIHRRFSPDTHPRLFIDYKGDDPLGFLVSRNVMRRHMNPSQRAAFAAEMCLRSPAHKHRPGVRSVDAARTMEVAVSQVKEAKRIARTEPKAFAEIKAGVRLIGRGNGVKTVNVLLAASEQKQFARKCQEAGMTITEALRRYVRAVNAGKASLLKGEGA
jgi:hypothetical protein